MRAVGLSWRSAALIIAALDVCAAALTTASSRAAVLRGVAAALTTLTPLTATAAADADAAARSLELLKQARAQLEPCDELIDSGAWDSVRTVVKTAPLQNVKNIVTSYIDQSGSEAAEDLVMPREDFVQALQLLDMNVYNNNFVGEQNGQGKKGAGVKVDRDTPRRYLRETKAALDEIIAFKL